MLQLQQQHLNASSIFRQEHDEMMRQGIALQQEKQELVERTEWLERENEQHRQAEHALQVELVLAKISAENDKTKLILEGRKAIHQAEEYTEARAEERHTLWRAEAEQVHWEDMQRVSLEAALRAPGEKPKGLCPGCVNKDSIINVLEERCSGSQAT